jgi:cytochrome b6-f complex iron-sulfur subunit
VANEELKDREFLQTGEEDEGAPTLWARRDFFSLAGWAGVLAALGASLLGFARFMFPRVLFEPTPVFKAGLPDEYPVGSVSERWKKDQRVWIVREPDGFYAISAICTHLGCTPNWLQTENKFKCPCHGSGFKRTGVNFEGPAPRPLERVRIALADDGQLLIDKSVNFRKEKGEWGRPGSILKV